MLGARAEAGLTHTAKSRSNKHHLIGERLIILAKIIGEGSSLSEGEGLKERRIGSMR